MHEVSRKNVTKWEAVDKKKTNLRMHAWLCTASVHSKYAVYRQCMRYLFSTACIATHGARV